MHIAIYLDDGEVLSKKTSVAGQTRSAVYGDRGWGRHRPAAQRDCRHPSDAAVCAGWFILGIAILTPIFHTTWENTQMDCKEERKMRRLQEPAVSNGHESSMIRIVGIQDRRPGGSVVKVSRLISLSLSLSLGAPLSRSVSPRIINVSSR